MPNAPLEPIAQRPAVSAVGLVVAGAAVVVVLWFLAQIAMAILLLFFAAVVAIALAAPVDWLVRKGLSRRLAAPLVLLLFFATIALLCWLVIPRLVEQMVALANGLPALIRQFENEVARLLSNYPDLQRFARFDGAPGNVVPAAASIVAGVGAFSLNLLGGIALIIIFFSIILYIVLDPLPILRGYIGSLPVASRPAGVRAYRRAVRAVVGWARASLVIGAIEFVLVFFFLSLIDMPAALVWAALAFFAEFIPRIGGYVMAFPPVLVALAMGPMTAIWVALFYLVMNEILGNLLAPRIRGATMQLHPVLLIFFTLAFALAFGLLGAVVATPAAAFASAYYSEFYMKRPLAR
jgi:putative permease